MTEAFPGSFAHVGPGELAIRLGVAVLAGLVLGLDREIRHRLVGVRTYMLVSLGAAAFSVVTMELSVQMSGREISVDPTRITQGLIGALGFLGAGAIIQGRGHVGGIATAASIWVAGAAGMASGLGYYTHSLMVAAIAAVILAISYFIPTRGSSERPELRDRDQDG